MNDIKFPRALIPAEPTKVMNVELNLDSRIQNIKEFDPENPYDTSDYTTGLEVFDSQGNKHLMTLFFNKTADRTWTYRGMVDGEEVTGGEPGKLSEVTQGQLTFTTDGLLDTETVSSIE